MLALSPNRMRRAGTVLICSFALSFALGRPVFAGAETGPLLAFYLQQIPSAYAAQEKVISPLQDTGAKAVIVDLPLNVNGLPDYARLSNLIYLIHKTGLKAIVIVPVRDIPGILMIHNDWEDTRYDLSDGSVGRSGRLDLFNTDVVFALNELFRKIASFSVDGIFLGADFPLGPGDGLSDIALARSEERLGERVSPKKLFMRSGGGSASFGPLFWKWQEVKRDRMLQVYDSLARSARMVNSSVVFGIPAPVILPVPVARDILAQYAYDMRSFKQRNVDYYWTSVPPQGLSERQNPGYRQSMELISRAALAASTVVEDTARLVVMVAATSQDGKLLPLSEIEEKIGLVRHAGDIGIAYSILGNAVIDEGFMKKMFRQRE